MLCGFRLQRFHLLSVEVKGSSQAAMLGFYDLSERNIPQLREVKVHDANFWHFYIFYLNSLQIFDQPASENQWNWSLWLPVTLKVVKGYSVKQVINGGLGQISRWMPEIVLAWAFNALTKINIKLSKSWSWICSARHLFHRPPLLGPPMTFTTRTPLPLFFYMHKCHCLPGQQANSTAGRLISAQNMERFIFKTRALEQCKVKTGADQTDDDEILSKKLLSVVGGATASEHLTTWNTIALEHQQSFIKMCSREAEQRQRINHNSQQYI